MSFGWCPHWNVRNGKNWQRPEVQIPGRAQIFYIIFHLNGEIFSISFNAMTSDTKTINVYIKKIFHRNHLWDCSSVERMPRRFSTDIFSTDTFSTDTFSTDTFSTDTFSTDTFSTDTFSTDTFSTDIFSTSTQNETYFRPGAQFVSLDNGKM